MPNLVTYGTSSEIAGKWSTTSDIDDYGDEQGDKGNSTFTNNSTETTVKMDNMKLDTVGTGFDYAPYIRAEYTFGEGVDLSKCKMVSYQYKGANHQFTLYYDWNASVEYFGEGVWDYPFVEMPYAPEWETVHIDLGWMMSNGWQKGIPTNSVIDAATAFRFVVTNDMFDTSLWIENLKCIEDISGYTKLQKVNSIHHLQVSIQGKNLSVHGIQNGSRFSITNMLGQVVKSGIANENFNVNLQNSGKYILKVGNSQMGILVK